MLLVCSSSGKVNWESTTANEESHAAAEEEGPQGNIEVPLRDRKEQETDLRSIGAQFGGNMEAE